MARPQLFTCLLLFSTSALATAPKGPWDAFNFAPDSRTVWPRSVIRAIGSVEGATNLTRTTGTATLIGNKSYVTLDFGIEVGLSFLVLAVLVLLTEMYRLGV